MKARNSNALPFPHLPQAVTLNSTPPFSFLAVHFKGILVAVIFTSDGFFGLVDPDLRASREVEQ
jgi:hypothetical protein